jgi:hypothetical protein
MQPTVEMSTACTMQGTTAARMSAGMEFHVYVRSELSLRNRKHVSRGVYNYLKNYITQYFVNVTQAVT